MAATNFREAYAVLKKHADSLREQREPNIDDLLKIVTESVDAYKVCKTRIEAVEKALEEALSDAGIEAGSAQTRAAEKPTGREEHPALKADGDDIPF